MSTEMLELRPKTFAPDANQARAKGLEEWILRPEVGANCSAAGAERWGLKGGQDFVISPRAPELGMIAADMEKYTAN